MDSLASSIRLDVLNNKVVRVLPRLDEMVNEEWITNICRWSYDSFLSSRLYYPKVRVNGHLIIIS
jgi:NADH-quinone oxidoreductase subunit G